MQLRLPRGLLPAAERRAAERRSRTHEFVEHRDAITPWCTSRWPVLLAASGATRTRWRCWSASSARCRRSITTRSTSTIAHHREVSAIRLIAKLPTLVAMAYKYTMGQPFVYPRNELSYAANFMRMMFVGAVRGLQGRTTCWCARSTASSSCTPTTSRTRRRRRCACAGSSGANPFACIAAGIACLWGPAHGGANEAALNMLVRDQASGVARSASSSSR